MPISRYIKNIGDRARGGRGVLDALNGGFDSHIPNQKE